LENFVYGKDYREGNSMKRRVGVFGWGIVAPKSPNVAAFRKNLAGAESWLTPFEGFGPNNFLVGQPDFDFNDYRAWIDTHFAPRHFQNLKEKMDTPSLYAIGAFIQALEQNPGIDNLLHDLGGQAHVYIGTGLGAIDTSYKSSIALYEAQKRWNAFWAMPEHNSALATYLKTGQSDTKISLDPALAPAAEQEEARAAWNAFWMAVSPELEGYLEEDAAIDSLTVEGNVESGKLNVLRERSKRHARLQEKWQSPEPPWKVSANFIWNIHNTPASQVSILAKITGLVFAPVAACSTFGVALRLGMRAIETGDAKVVVIGIESSYRPAGNTRGGRGCGVDRRGYGIPDGTRLSPSGHGASCSWSERGCASHHHSVGRWSESSDGTSVKRGRCCSRRCGYLGLARDRYAWGLLGVGDPAFDASRPGFGDSSEGDVRTRHECRGGLGVDRAVYGI
jgi:hypothetical protein